MMYRYLGDRHTDPALKGMLCAAVKRADGKCIRTKTNMLVEREDGKRYVVLGRLLRKVKP